MRLSLNQPTLPNTAPVPWALEASVSPGRTRRKRSLNDREKWRGLLDSALPEEELREVRSHTCTGRPLGNKALVERVEGAAVGIFACGKLGKNQSSLGRKDEQRVPRLRRIPADRPRLTALGSVFHEHGSRNRFAILSECSAAASLSLRLMASILSVAVIAAAMGSLPSCRTSSNPARCQ